MSRYPNYESKVSAFSFQEYGISKMSLPIYSANYVVIHCFDDTLSSYLFIVPLCLNFELDRDYIVPNPERLFI